jgi:hypothetical protein
MVWNVAASDGTEFQAISGKKLFVSAAGAVGVKAGKTAANNQMARKGWRIRAEDNHLPRRGQRGKAGPARRLQPTSATNISVE